MAPRVSAYAIRSAESTAYHALYGPRLPGQSRHTAPSRPSARAAADRPAHHPVVHVMGATRLRAPPSAKESQASARKAKPAQTQPQPEPRKREWSAKERVELLANIMQAGYKGTNFDALAAKYGVTKTKLRRQLFPGAGTLRSKILSLIERGLTTKER